MDEHTLKSVVQPLRFLRQSLEDGKELYNDKILWQRLTLNMHIRLHSVFQSILDKLKVLTNRLENKYDNKEIWAIANGYSHKENVSFGYFYKGGEHICEYVDAPPIYVPGWTFNPEEAINQEISRIDIVLTLQGKRDDQKEAARLTLELNEFIFKLVKFVDELEESYGSATRDE